MIENIKQSLRDFSEEELSQIVKELGFPAFRAKQLADWLYKKHILVAKEAKNLPKDFLEALEKKYSFSSLECVESQQSSDNSNKFLFKTQKGELIETVYIHQGGERHALCLTTQVGCKMACRFCASGKLGWERNLSAGEILEQVSQAIRIIGAPIDNIVFMGMGEPLDNFDAFLKSIRTLKAPWGYGMGGRRITVSTSGLIPAIERFAKEAPGEVKLAVSLHGTTEESRQKLMPINKAYPLKDLIECLERVQRNFKRQVTFEYIMIKGLNDSPGDAERLADFALRLNAKVNLIPYNKIEGETFERPAVDVMKRFQTFLLESDVTVTLRYSAGSDINAACGQLRLLRHAEDYHQAPRPRS